MSPSTKPILCLSSIVMWCYEKKHCDVTLESATVVNGVMLVYDTTTSFITPRDKKKLFPYGSHLSHHIIKFGISASTTSGPVIQKIDK